MRKALGTVLIINAVLAGVPCFASEEIASPFAVRPHPDLKGQRIVFESDLADPRGPLQVWAVGIDGTDAHRLTSSSLEERDPVWSPDGTRIAFAGRNNAATWDIYVVNADGTSLQAITSASLNNTEPVWSPDGSRLAFISDRGGTKDIWQSSPSGANVTRLSSLPGQENHPAFSPDGSNVVFSETVGDSASLFVVRADGSSTPVAITPSGSHDWAP